MTAIAPVRTIGEGWDVLVEEMARRDQHAMRRFFDESQRLAYSLAFRILGNASDAEEAMLDAYMQAWRLAPQFEPGRGSAYTWLMTFVRCRAIDRLRSRRVRPEEALDDAPARACVAVEDPEADTATVRFREQVARVMEQMPAGSREALELAYFEGLSHAEISERLGEPLGTVKTRIRRGLGILRERLVY